MEEYKVNVVAGTKVLADMVEAVKEATFDATTEIKAVKGGETIELAVVLLPGPIGIVKKMTNVTGWFKWNNQTWEAPKVNLNSNWWDGSDWTLGTSVPIPLSPGTNQIIEGGQAIVNQDGVFKNSTIIYIGNAADSSNIQDGLITSSGAFGPGTGYKRIKNIPAYNGIPMTISGIRPGNAKRIAFYSEKDGAGFLKLSGTVNVATVTIIPSGLPVNGGYLAILIKVDTEATDEIAFPALQVEYSNIASVYSPFTGKRKAIKVSTVPIEAEYISENAKIGGKNIASESYVKDNAILNSDFTLAYGINMLNPDSRVLGKFIDSNGNILTGEGWEYTRIDVSALMPGDRFTVGPMAISSGHSAWYAGEVKKGYAGVYSTGTLPKVYTVPDLDVKDLLITTMRNNISNPNIMVNLGEIPLPYEPYVPPSIDTLKGYVLSGQNNNPGGEDYDQSLNTTDSVTFAKGTFLALSLPLPTGAGVPPESSIVGDIWIDTNDGGALKTKLS